MSSDEFFAKPATSLLVNELTTRRIDPAGIRAKKRFHEPDVTCPLHASKDVQNQIRDIKPVASVNLHGLAR